MKQYSILIIDDEPEFINTIINILDKTETKFQFYHAISGEIGFEIALLKQPDIILTDWDMPGWSGIDLINKLNTEKNTSKIPVIMVTGKMTSPEALEEAFTVGAIDFVRKPIERIELIARIKSVIKIFEYQKLEIKLKNQELLTHTTYLAHNNQFLTKLLSQVKEIKLISPTNRRVFDAEVEKIEKKIEDNIVNDTWSKFSNYFQQIHPEFEQKLIKNYPQLKPTDIKLAILLRLNLSSKEISEIIFQQVDSIKTARYRLRKKMQLSAKENLTSFILAI